MVSALAALWSAGGCAALRGSKPRADQRQTPPTLLRQAYPDLHNARFVVIADFDDPTHARSFQIVTGDDFAEQPNRGPTIARDDEPRGLAAALGPGERLVLHRDVGGRLSLPENWTDQTLLLVSVHSSDGGQALRTEVGSAGNPGLTWTATTRLAPGWNRLRFDLADLRDRIDLANVEFVRWYLADSTEPASLTLGTLALANNTVSALSSPTDWGRFQVVSRGQRTAVGVQGEFELEFAGGLIMSWRDQGGPNLAPADGLGPHSSSIRGAGNYAGACGPDPIGTPTVAEAGSFRAVIEFADSAHSARYTVYPDGSVYMGSGDDSTTEARCELRLLNRSGFRAVAPSQHSADRPGPRFTLFSQAEPSRPDLLWCVRDAKGPRQPRVDAPRADTLTATAESLVGPTAHLLRVLPRDLNGAEAGAAFAADYQESAVVSVTNGAIVTTRPGDLDRDGFNEAEGLYELELSDGILRARFDPAQFPRTNARFRVAGTARMRCRVVAGGRILSQTGRDAGGDLMFLLAGLTDTQVALEVYVQP